MTCGTMSEMNTAALAYYPLKGNPNDYTDNNRNGTISGNVTYVPGVYGNAANFQQSGALVQLPSSQFERYANFYTLCAWVNLSAVAPVSGESSDGGVIAGRLQVDYSTGKLRFYFYYDSASSPDNRFIVLESNGTLKTDLWTHVMVMYDHSTLEFSFYFNGMMDSMQSLAGPVRPSDRPQLPVAFAIGGNVSTLTPSYTFNGSVSDVIIFNDTLEMCCLNSVAGYMNFTALATPSQSVGADDARSAENTEAVVFIPVFIAIVVAVAVVSIIYQVTLVSEIQSQPSASPSPKQPTLSVITNEIARIVGSPAKPGKQVSRSDLGILDSQRIRIDIGGLGAYIHSGTGTLSGFADSLNMNDVKTNPDSAPPNATIENLILVNNWNTQPAFPLANGFADYITMQSAPLYPFYVNEINRVLRKGGMVGLWIDEDTFQPQINQLAGLFNCTPLPCTAANGNLGMDEFHGNYVFPKLLLTKNT